MPPAMVAATMFRMSSVLTQGVERSARAVNLAAMAETAPRASPDGSLGSSPAMCAKEAAAGIPTTIRAWPGSFLATGPGVTSTRPAQWPGIPRPLLLPVAVATGGVTVL